MRVFIAALIFLGISIFIMCFNIIFRKGKEFPDSIIEHNKELRKRGIICPHEEEIRMWKKTHKTAACNSCEGNKNCVNCAGSEN